MEVSDTPTLSALLASLRASAGSGAVEFAQDGHLPEAERIAAVNLARYLAAPAHAVSTW